MTGNHMILGIWCWVGPTHDENDIDDENDKDDENEENDENNNDDVNHDTPSS